MTANPSFCLTLPIPKLESGFQKGKYELPNTDPASFCRSAIIGKLPWTNFLPLYTAKELFYLWDISNESLYPILKIRSKLNNIWKICLEVWDLRMSRFPILRMEILFLICFFLVNLQQKKMNIFIYPALIIYKSSLAKILLSVFFVSGTTFDDLAISLCSHSDYLLCIYTGLYREAWDTQWCINR